MACCSTCPYKDLFQTLPAGFNAAGRTCDGVIYTPTQWSILSFFGRHLGVFRHRETITDALYEHRRDGGPASDTFSPNLSAIRKKLLGSRYEILNRSGGFYGMVEVEKADS